MRLGLSCSSYRIAGELDARERMISARELLARARALGLDGVQLLCREQADSRDFSGLVALRQLAEEEGLFVELAAVGTQPEAVKTAVRTASVLGSQVLSLCLGVSRPAKRTEIEPSLKTAAGNLRQALPTCEKYGVALAVENAMDFTSAELLQLLEQVNSEWAGISFDTGNQLAVMEAPATALAALAPFLYNLHLSDWQLSAYADGLVLRGCALGEGVIEIPALLRTARSHAPQVSVHVASRPETRELPVLTASFLDRFPDRRTHDLAALLRLYWERGSQPPMEADADLASRGEAMLERGARYLLSLREQSSQELECSKPSPRR